MVAYLRSLLSLLLLQVAGRAALDPQRDNMSLSTTRHLMQIWYSSLCFVLLLTSSASEMKQDSASSDIYSKTTPTRVPFRGTQTGSASSHPAVLDQLHLKQYISKFHSGKFEAMQSGICGSQSSSQLVTMDTGEQFCCQFHHNSHMVQGELLTYHLMRVLGLGNRVPITMATQVHYTDDRLQVVRDAMLNEARWPLGAILVCSDYVKNLQEEVALPLEMREMVHQHFPRMNKQGEMESKVSDYLHFKAAISDPLSSQWVELVVLDYLTGNTDRLVNTLTSYQYNSDIVDAPVHNLAQNPSGDLVLFDHDRSFWIGYQFADGDKRMKIYQEFFLMQMCTFPSQLLTSLSQVCKQPYKVGETLTKSFQMLDAKSFELVYPISNDVIGKLQERVSRLCEHIVHTCELFSGSVH